MQRAVHPLSNQAATVEAHLDAAGRFEEFHAANPHFYDALVRLARRYVSTTGRAVIGMQRLIEVARWDVDLVTEGDDEFKVNNNHAAFYARLIMLQEPDLAGRIPTRSSPDADRWIALVKHNGLLWHVDSRYTRRVI